MIHVAGSPIGGENPPHDKRWRATVAAAAVGADPVTAVQLDFRLEPHRTVDLDNLVRPVLAGLRDAGVFFVAIDGSTRSLRPRRQLARTLASTSSRPLLA